MKCPKCGYLGYQDVERCRNCGYDFSLTPNYKELDPGESFTYDVTLVPSDTMLVDKLEFTSDTRYIDKARGWMDRLETHFRDTARGGYYLSSVEATDVLARVRRKLKSRLSWPNCSTWPRACRSQPAR